MLWVIRRRYTKLSQSIRTDILGLITLDEQRIDKMSVWVAEPFIAMLWDSFLINLVRKIASWVLDSDTGPAHLIGVF
jgi:hypothetical protein